MTKREKKMKECRRRGVLFILEPLFRNENKKKGGKSVFVSKEKSPNANANA